MIHLHKHKRIDVPAALRHIPDAPRNLYCIGDQLDELLQRPRVAIVGSRQMSPYGEAITSKLATQLAGQGVVIVSGLAYGVDACAHQAAVLAGGQCLVVQANGLDKLYPSAHAYLGKQIVEHGGVILSEYPEGNTPQKHMFLRRNRLISGLSQAVIITEAAERSGTLNTAAHALNQGLPVFAVPGNITNPLSVGTNNLIKAGATPLTAIADLEAVLGVDLKAHRSPVPADDAEASLIKLLSAGVSAGDILLRESGLSAAVCNQALTMLEITGKIRALGNNQWALS